ncbi:YeeE/YedE thiosulfate transporter family protein [Roseateles sp. GG27B]
MRRYLVGPVLMGFGGMLAWGCAVGAGLSGAAVFSVTSWVTLSAIWAAAALTDAWFDQRAERKARTDTLYLVDQAMSNAVKS